MKKHLTFVSKTLIYLSLLTLMLLGVPTTMAQGPWPGPVQLILPAQPGQSSTFIGAGIEARTILSGSSQLLGNPGFESGDWSPWETFGAPALDSNTKHSGSRSARLGNVNNADDQLIQMVTVPADASAVTVDFWYRLTTDETNLEADFFCYGLWDQSGNTAFVVHCQDLGTAGDQEWNRETYSLTTDERVGVVGQTVLMAFIVQTNASLPSQVWVDDIALPVTTPGDPPPPVSNYMIYLPLTRNQQNLPVIVSFTANPATIAPGGSSVLSWQVNGATGLSISPDVGPVTGSSVSVSPATTTQYTLTASNAAGSTTAQTTVTVSSGGGGGSAAAFWLPYTSASGDLLPTYGTNVAVDSAGGIHVGYAIHTGLDNGQRPAYYAYCAANCANPASWTRTRLSDFVQDVRLALDPLTGHPRMLFYTSDDPNLADNDHEYQYAVCEGGCTSSANWIITGVAVVSEIPGGRSYQNNHYFALDPQGNPAFVFSHSADGTVYAYCGNTCTNATNWHGVQVVNGQWPSKPALAFTPAGDPRMLIDFWDTDNTRHILLFIGCDTLACNNSRGRFLVTNTASGAPATIGDAYFSLGVDTNGQPRIALYTGETVTPPLQLTTLHYLWCNTDCLNPNADTWNLVSPGLPTYHGKGVDLVLDPANRPRLAYEMGGEGLGYAWCNANCEGASNWQAHTVESTEAVIAQYPPGLPQHQNCPILTWFNGVRPSLALDPAGNPRLGYDAELWWGGSNPYIRCDIDVPLARFALFNQP